MYKECPKCGAQINKPTCENKNRPQTPYPKVYCNQCSTLLNPICKAKKSINCVPNRGIRTHTEKYLDMNLNMIGIRCTKIRTRVKIIDNKVKVMTSWASNYNPDNF